MKAVLHSKRASVSQRKEHVPQAGHESRVSSRPRRSYTATEAKNQFGRVLDEVLQGATVVITKHDAPKAVLISVDEFNALKQAPQAKLNTLSAEFDELLSRMQTATARAGMERAFDASPARLGKAAVAMARKRG